MRKLYYLLFIAVIASSASYGQQDAQFTQNMFNRFAVNPGVAGSNEAICGTLIGRQQNIGFEGHPQTNSFSAEGAFNDPWLGLSHGAGLTVWQDKLGAENTFSATLSYAYRQSLFGGVGELGIGVNGGILNKSINSTWVSPEGDGTEDPAIPDAGTSDLTFDLGFGVYYHTENLYVGLSSTHLVPGSIEATGSVGNPNVGFKEWEQDFDLTRHYYIMAGYNYRLENNPDFELQPSVFVKSDAASTQLDLNCNLLWKQTFWGGLSYRVQDAAAVLLGMHIAQVPGLSAGIAYDITTSELARHSSGSAELMIKYCHKISTEPKMEKYHSVRFL